MRKQGREDKKEKRIEYLYANIFFISKKRLPVIFWILSAFTMRTKTTHLMEGTSVRPDKMEIKFVYGMLTNLSASYLI